VFLLSNGLGQAGVADGRASRSGGVFGGQLGYRWQVNQFVFGLEGQGDWADLSNTRVSFVNPLFSTRTKTDGIGLFTGQVGWAWNATLLYVKGGAAVTSNRFSILSTLSGNELVAASSTRWGGTVGAGFEYGFAPNWSAGLEYDHLFMGNSNNSFSIVNPIVAGALNRVSQDVDMVTVRVNYRFGGFGAPVAAHY
jgi:outer membrane immunogenic protein